MSRYQRVDLFLIYIAYQAAQGNRYAKGGWMTTAFNAPTEGRKRPRDEGKSGGMKRIPSKSAIGAFGGSNSALSDTRDATDDLRVTVRDPA